jgi:hypothetical protein
MTTAILTFLLGLFIGAAAATALLFWLGIRIQDRKDGEHNERN